MKKVMLSGAVCAVLFSACSKQQANDPVAPGTIRFDIEAVNTLSTRGDLLSQTPDVTVGDVQVYAFKNDGSSNYIYASTIDMGWSSGELTNSKTLAGADVLAAGDYKFLVIGKDTGDATFTLPTLTGLDYTAFLATASTVGVSELFTGTASQTIVSGQGTRITIQISRKVAGVLAYFANIPAEIEGTAVAKLRLVASSANTTLDLSAGTGSVPFVSLPVDLINVDLTGQTVASGVYAGNGATSGAVQLSNSQLNGLYMIPAIGITLTLRLDDGSGNALKTWTVQSSGSSTIDITANTLFTIGQKKATDSTDNGTSDDATDDDQAVNLLTDEGITVNISTNWGDVSALDLVAQ